MPRRRITVRDLKEVIDCAIDLGLDPADSLDKIEPKPIEEMEVRIAFTGRMATASVAKAVFVNGILYIKEGSPIGYLSSQVCEALED